MSAEDDAVVVGGQRGGVGEMERGRHRSDDARQRQRGKKAESYIRPQPALKGGDHGEKAEHQRPCGKQRGKRREFGPALAKANHGAIIAENLALAACLGPSAFVAP